MIDIIVLLPKDRCTKIQQLQMTTVKDANVHNFVGMKSKFRKIRVDLLSKSKDLLDSLFGFLF